MGCGASSAPQDPQALLEKQRQIMLQRQRDFEEKRAAQAAAAAAATGGGGGSSKGAIGGSSMGGGGGGRPAAVDTQTRRDGGSKDTEPHSTTSVASSTIRKDPSTPNNVVINDVKNRDRSASSQRPPGDSVGKNSSASASLPGDSKEKRPSNNIHTGTTPSAASPAPNISTGSSSNNNNNAPSSTLAPLGPGDENYLPPIDEATKRKYTINDDSMEAADKRKSKNMHDLGQFMSGAKAVRRASFNPAAIANTTTTTSEQHAKNTVNESEQQQSTTIKKDIIPVISEEVGRLTVTDDGRSLRETFVAPAGDVINSDGTFGYGTASVPDSTTTTTGDNNNGDGPQISEERAAKFVARDPNDRKSKNLHDLGQYMAKGKDFARRTSFQPAQQQQPMLSAEEISKLEGS
jgi:hypothetical protein